MNKRIAGLAMMALLWAAGAPAAGASEVMVYKSPACGCCKKWLEHLRAHGFNVKTQDVADLAPYRIRNGVPPALESCHTALAEGYVIEGHVPAQDLRRLLRERPAVRGLAVPGMPNGSPGMENGLKDRYEVLTFDRAGNVAVYARH